MPEQPPDPLHYEMKIPPEPKSSRRPQDPAKSEADDNETASHTAKDTNVGRGDDKPQSVRHSE